MDELRFLCDEMLQGVGRWLRAAGYDALIAAPGTPDRELLQLARATGRCFITRDRRMRNEHPRLSDGVVVLEQNGIVGCLRELAEQMPIDWLRAPFSRCLLCNTALQLASARRAAQVPESVRLSAATVWLCPVCDKLYWDGSHARRMRAKLEAYARGQWH